jgi:glycosyltransferase involved in cell wall biosynthesis
LLKLIFLQSHPIQYMAPLFQRLAQEENVNLTVLYGSDETVKGSVDAQFGVQVKWDIPLLEGYHHVFLQNHAPNPSIKAGFFGLMNWGLWRHLRTAPPSYVVVPGWKYFSYVLAILIAPLFGHKVCLRLETPLNQELKKEGWKTTLRRFVMQHLLFRMTSYFLYIGEQNRQFYRHFGVPENRLIFSPYAVDNDRFHAAYRALNDQKGELRAQLQLPEDAVIFLYSGKYMAKKNPLDAIRAFHAASGQSDAPAHLVLVGDGALRPKMEALLQELDEEQVTLTGFVNQSKIPEYYAVADVFLMPSGMGETWGLSTNEAMNFGLPVLQYDLTGSSADLVEEGKNGFAVPYGDVATLAEKMAYLIDHPEFREQAGQRSLEIIPRYSYKVIIDQLKTHLPA